MSSPVEYDYPNIEACAEAIQKAVSDIEQEVSNVANETKKLFGDGWTGSSASAYDQKSGEIRQMLDEKNQTMTAVEKQVRKAIEDMQRSDSGGAKKISGG